MLTFLYFLCGFFLWCIIGCMGGGLKHGKTSEPNTKYGAILILSGPFSFLLPLEGSKDDR